MQNLNDWLVQNLPDDWLVQQTAAEPFVEPEEIPIFLLRGPPHCIVVRGPVAMKTNHLNFSSMVVVAFLGTW